MVSVVSKTRVVVILPRNIRAHHIPMNKNVFWNAPPAAVGVLCEASNRETADRMPGPNI